MKLSGDRTELTRRTARPYLIAAILLWVIVAVTACNGYLYNPSNITPRLLIQRVPLYTQQYLAMGKQAVSSEFPKIEISAAGVKRYWWLLLRQRLYWKNPSFYLRYAPHIGANGGYRDLASANCNG